MCQLEWHKAFYIPTVHHRNRVFNSSNLLFENFQVSIPMATVQTRMTAQALMVRDYFILQVKNLVPKLEKQSIPITVMHDTITLCA